ncbi:unnamed protein product [Porites lobata]|uniref:G-protein coupled receptors family 1 profile domain-containing protein n=1 Tax=Porites lobata TaxID=104759 RepID=A0ABN8RR97_9CNID|nr:unnamed protein product [Porites lobata]
MLINSDTDAAIFIINCTFTSVFCLRCEYKDLKSSVLLVLALSDWLSVFSRTLTTLTHDINLWSAAACVCEQPQVLLQTGIFILNLAIIQINTDLSEFNSPKRNSYLHLVLFNAASCVLSRAIIQAIASTLDDSGNNEVADYVLGVLFLLGIYRTVFLSLDCLYHAYANTENRKTYSLTDHARHGDKVVIINI